MFKTILSYAASNGVQRAMSFLASLLLLRVYTSAEVGEYVLLQTIAQLMIPLATLNVTVALTREAKVDVFRTVHLLKRISIAVLVAFALAAVAFAFAGTWRWICAAVMLGLAEALYNSLTAFLMGREHSTKVLKISLVRVFVFLILLIATYLKYLAILQFVLLVATFLVGLSLAVIWSIVLRVEGNTLLKRRSSITIATMYGYSIGTLPHTAALWVSVSSDRTLLGALEGKEAVGEYAIAFTLAQSVMVLLAGVISAIPPRIINDVETWTKPSVILGFIKKIAGLTIVINVFALTLFFLNDQYLDLVPNSSSGDLITLSLIGSSYFMSLFYVFFASYLYQQRKTAALTWMGFVLLPANLAMIYLFVFFFSKIGAAAGLLMSYTSFGVAYGIAAVQLVPELRGVFPRLAMISLLQVLSSLAIAYLFLLMAY